MQRDKKVFCQIKKKSNALPACTTFISLLSDDDVLGQQEDKSLPGNRHSGLAYICNMVVVRTQSCLRDRSKKGHFEISI